MLIRSSSPFIVIWTAIRGWWDNLIVLSLISAAWLACWVTIILGPPATFGLYCAVHELAEENTTSFRTAYEGARRYFLVSWGWMLANLIVLIMLVLNWMFYGGVSSALGLTIQLITLVVALFWFGAQFYGLPFFFLQEKRSIWTAWRNGIYTALSSPLRALVVWVVILILLAVGVVFILPLILGIPALIALLGAVGVRERLIAYGLLKPEEFEKGP